MRLTNPCRTSSFYESFSDLIFATLIVFIVVVMALVMRIRGAQMEFDKACEANIVLNQFTGGPDQSEWTISLVLRNGEPHVAFIPKDVWSVWSARRMHGHTDPVMRLCEAYLARPKRIAIVPQEEFQRLDDSISLDLWRSLTRHSSIGVVVNRIMATEQAHGGDLSQWRPQRLSEFVGGISAGKGAGDAYDHRLHRSEVAYHEFLFGGNPLPETDSQRWRWRYDQLLEPLHEVARGKAHDAPPRVQFREAPGQRIRLGRMVIEPEQFVALLRTYSVGRGFYIEYLADSGEEESPPEWIVNRVLVPSGFDKRIASEPALRAIRDLRRDS